MLLFGISASVVEKLKNALPSKNDVISWPFDEASEGFRGFLLPLNEVHLRAWRERYQVDFDALSVGQAPNPYRQSVDLLCDRVFVEPISSNDRILYLARLEALLKAEAQKVTPGVAVFSSTPHFPWELLCAKVLLENGHRVYSFRPTHVDGRILVQEHLLSSGLMRFVSRDELNENSSEQKLVLDDRLFADSGAPISTLNQISQHDLASLDSLRSLACRASEFLFRKILRKLPAGARPNGGATAGNYFGFYSAGKRRFFQVKRVVLARQNIGVLRALAPRQLPSDYVLFMLHFQPERTTDPESGLARFQASALVELRKKMDDEGLESLAIVVKEHPRQILRWDLGERTLLARSADFYEAIAGLHNCYLVGPKVGSESLIRRARLVVTPNGTAAWEALLNGRPGITFAETWHSTCAASPSWDALTRGDVSLRELLSMDREAVVGSVKRFAEVERTTHAGVMDERYVKADALADLQAETGRLLAELVALGV